MVESKEERVDRKEVRAMVVEGEVGVEMEDRKVEREEQDRREVREGKKEERADEEALVEQEVKQGTKEALMADYLSREKHGLIKKLDCN